MSEELPDGTRITCPLCREETTTVERNERNKPYFYQEAVKGEHPDQGGHGDVDELQAARDQLLGE
jgi:hypothetical protein